MRVLSRFSSFSGSVSWTPPAFLIRRGSTTLLSPLPEEMTSKYAERERNDGTGVQVPDNFADGVAVSAIGERNGLVGQCSDTQAEQHARHFAPAARMKVFTVRLPVASFLSSPSASALGQISSSLPSGMLATALKSSWPMTAMSLDLSVIVRSLPFGPNWTACLMPSH